jgi:hypothetical protein
MQQLLSPFYETSKLRQLEVPAVGATISEMAITLRRLRHLTLSNISLSWDKAQYVDYGVSGTATSSCPVSTFRVITEITNRYLLQFRLPVPNIL